MFDGELFDEVDPDTVELEGVLVLRRVPNAILINYEGTEVWLPARKVKWTGRDSLRIPEWLANEKGLL